MQFINNNSHKMSEYVTNIIEFSNVIVRNVFGKNIALKCSMICPSCLMFDAHKGH